jgi:hypothetical protein
MTTRIQVDHIDLRTGRPGWDPTCLAWDSDFHPQALSATCRATAPGVSVWAVADNMIGTWNQLAPESMWHKRWAFDMTVTWVNGRTLATSLLVYYERGDRALWLARGTTTNILGWDVSLLFDPDALLRPVVRQPEEDDARYQQRLAYAYADLPSRSSGRAFLDAWGVTPDEQALARDLYEHYDIGRWEW